MAKQSKVALVTGASRGIGKACALSLAKSGFDVVVTARTVNEGQAFERSSTIAQSDIRPLPGNLEQTAAQIREFGRTALVAKLDLLDRDDIEQAVEFTLAELGRVDVLVNNARFIGPGNQDLFVDTPVEVFDDQFQCNVFGPLQLAKLVVPPMTDQGGGLIVNITSSAGHVETPKLPGQGGWGLAYSITKAALTRLTIGLAKELREHNIAVVNLEPGYVATERNLEDMTKLGYDMSQGLATSVPGAVCAAIATHPNPMFFSGKMVDAPLFSVEHELVTVDELPSNYGASEWGVPRRLPHEW